MHLIFRISPLIPMAKIQYNLQISPFSNKKVTKNVIRTLQRVDIVVNLEGMNLLNKRKVHKFVVHKFVNLLFFYYFCSVLIIN